MSKIWAFMIVFSIIVAVALGTGGDITKHIMTAGTDAVQNILKLAGMLCFWSGIFNIAKETSLLKKISNALAPLIMKLFNKKEITDESKEAMSLNIASNLIGVGNVATIYGIKAVEELNKVNKDKTRASDNMVMFVLMNTASLQIIPTSIIMLRAMYLSKDPTGIVPAVWFVTVVALTVGIVSAKILNRVIK